MERIRAFIAIEMTDAVRAALSAFLNELRPKEHPYVKWVDPTGVHLTLKFLGNIAPNQVASIEKAIVQGACDVPPFKLGLGQRGAFPNITRPRVIWVGLTGELERLGRLQAGIERALVPLGFPAESRPFSPHLTLGRLREGASPVERKQIGDLVAASQSRATAAMEVVEVNLMRSTLTPQGALYSRIASVRLEALKDQG